MSLPQMPSDVLAKMVIGYLEEEQLTSTQEKFFRESPYVNPQHETDAIFTTSLRNMAREYRAAKVFASTCQPPELRKMLSQCGNLLEMVKFLVSNVDMQKVRRQRPWCLEECSICMELLKDDSGLRALACGHRFHGPCIATWLDQHSACPYCRAPLED